MTESQKQLTKIHQQYDFLFSDKCNELYAEAKECIENGDSEYLMDIWADIETAKKNFNSSLPWWYEARWTTNIYDQEIYNEAYRLYCKNIYNKEITTCNRIK